MGNLDTALDEAAVGRLRGAIGNEPDGLRTGEQLDGVLRMLGAAVIPEENQLSLFGETPAPRRGRSAAAGSVVKPL